MTTGITQRGIRCSAANGPAERSSRVRRASEVELGAAFCGRGESGGCDLPPDLLAPDAFVFDLPDPDFPALDDPELGLPPPDFFAMSTMVA